MFGLGACPVFSPPSDHPPVYTPFFFLSPCCRAHPKTDPFATGGDLGFTIAAPVYDTNSTTSNQPVFLGVVAMDFKVEVSDRC